MQRPWRRKPEKVAGWRRWGEMRPLEPLDAGLKRILSRPKPVK